MPTEKGAQPVVVLEKVEKLRVSVLQFLLDVV